MPHDHPAADPMGQAILDYATEGKHHHPLVVHSPDFDDDEIPVPYLFRTLSDMPRLEQQALSLCRGRVLDVGAGAGCHSLALQTAGKEVVSVDISALSTQARQMRGVKQALVADIFSDELPGSFATILLLMNGLGIAGTLQRLPLLLRRCRALLSPGGVVLADSTNLCYLYDDDEQASLAADARRAAQTVVKQQARQLQKPSRRASDVPYYYGQVTYSMSYGALHGPLFPWLYVDYESLLTIAAACGFRAERIADGPDHAYLAALTLV